VTLRSAATKVSHLFKGLYCSLGNRDTTMKEHMQYWSHLILQVLTFSHSNQQKDQW